MLELLKTRQEVEELKRYKASTVNAVSIALDELARARSKPDHDNRRLRQQLECTNRELVSSQSRLAESQTARIGMRYELDALTAQFYAFASEKQMLELALVDAHTMAQAKHDAARVAYDTLFAEQRRNAALEKKLMETKALYICATTRETSADPQCDDTSLVPETSSNFSDISGITVLEMELERDMYRTQEHEALQALEAERELRLAAERDRDACRDNEQLAVAAIEAHKMAYIKAEKDKVAAVAQLEAAYSRIGHRQVQAERYGVDLQREHFDLAVTKSERLQIEFGTVPAQATHYGAPRYNSTLPSVVSSSIAECLQFTDAMSILIQLLAPYE